MFSKEPRCIYSRNQLAEVICQIRFPEILTIGENIPADFQECIRDEYPVYSSRKEPMPPRITGVPGSLSLENQQPSINYQFASPDGIWRVNLTSKFISLACTRYTRWEEFAKQLDKPLAAFIRLYRPAYFERVGLRYLNFFSRKSLDLDQVPFSSLFTPTYLGPLSDDEMQEASTSRCSIDFESAIPGGGRVKLHAGPGFVKQNGIKDGEIRFIFDQDLFMQGNLAANLSAGILQTLHRQADAIFRGAITDTLHKAMDPRQI